MPTYFITGASRGIGLEYVRQLLASGGNTVIAAARKPSAPLTELTGEGKLHVVTCDVADKASIAQCGEKVRTITDRIDVLINNAGISHGNDSPSTVTPESLTEAFAVNVVGPALVVQALESLFQKGTVIVNTSSGLGSCADTLTRHGKINTGYSISKAALDMLSVKQALHFTDAIVISLDPGWVQTDMGGPGAIMPVEESVSHILKTVKGLKPEDSGYAFLFDGRKMPF